jgi:uncharacterized sulfatase
MLSGRTLGFVLIAFTCLRGANAAESTAHRPPNILLAIADDASWPHMSAYGCKFLKTPNFDRVAREGTLFNNCFTPTPKCSPSRAALLTGRNPWQLEEAADHFGIFSSKFKVYPDQLEAAGYHIGFTGKGWGPGDFLKGGFKHNPAGIQYNQLKAKPPTTGISPVDYAANFNAFLNARPKGEPFCFWYGGHEPHRPYELGSGVKSGKKLTDVDIAPYLPADDIVRSDVLDYALEIEWFDNHLGRMLKKLEEIGELDNTIVVVTSDNGMPFPRVKGHIFEDACHLPLAIRWGDGMKGGRTVDDFISFIDLAPTFLDAVKVKPADAMTGTSILSILQSSGSGQIDPKRDHVLLGRERTDIGRPGDVGYPVRAIRTRDYFYSHNFAPDRWPAGDPETGFTDIDDSPTKKDVLQLKVQGIYKWFDLAMGKRPAEELYEMKSDPGCVNNVAERADLADIRGRLWAQVQEELRAQNDPRMLGKGDAFDTYKYQGSREHAWDSVMGKKTEK